MTQNPIHALKITIYNTTHTKHTEIHFQKVDKMKAIKQLKQLFSNVYFIISNNSYFV